MDWYYTTGGGRREGPVDRAALEQAAADGRLQPDNWVWTVAMGAQWSRASQVPGLFPSVTPPPLPLLPPLPVDAAPLDAAPVATAGDRGPVPGAGLRISCIDPIGLAWDRMVAILFRPFAFKIWLVVGFAAWLATLSPEGGGLPFSDLSEIRKALGGETPAEMPTLQNHWQEMLSFLNVHRSWVIVGTVSAALLGLVLAVVRLWICSRGRFVFIDNVVHNRREIVRPWHAFKELGRRLFWWQIGYGAVMLCLMIPLLAGCYVRMIAPFVAWGSLDQDVLMTVLTDGWAWVFAGGLFLVALVAMFVAWALEDFVVPLMYHGPLGAADAWRRFLPMLSQYIWPITLYSGMRLLLGLAAGVVGMLIVALSYVLTCCLICCLLVIPFLAGYVTAVLLLPIHVFMRSYSLEFLAQFDADYRLGEVSSV